MEWIKCKDKLPRKSGYYFVVIEESYYPQKTRYVESCSIECYMANGKLQRKWNLDSSYCEVVAWLPIPKYDGEVVV